MLKNFPISLSGLVMNIKLAFEICHFDIQAILGGYNNLIGSKGRQIFYTNYRCIMIFITY